MFKWIKAKLADIIIGYLHKPVWKYEPFSITSPPILEDCLRPGDVLLVEGNLRISNIIKYLTQSTWSHATLYIGDHGPDGENGEKLTLIEAEADGGILAVPLSKYKKFNTRICRPHRLSHKDVARLIAYARGRIGQQYDMENIIDLVRYLVPYPPVPVSFRRRMLALGGGDPTRAICSTLIAQAFQSVHYPILPNITRERGDNRPAGYTEREIFHIRHHRLFTPRDFDLSPYFHIIKPTLETGFDYKAINWAQLETDAESGKAPRGPDG